MVTRKTVSRLEIEPSNPMLGCSYAMTTARSSGLRAVVTTSYETMKTRITQNRSKVNTFLKSIQGGDR